MKIVGTILIIIGLALAAVSSFTYFSQEQILKVGTVELTHNQPHYLSWSPFIGLAVMVVGGFLILQGRKKI